MSKEKKQIQISIEELNRQKEFMESVKNYNKTDYTKTKKKYFLNTFGCQMNEHDSEKIEGMLAEMGYEFVDNSNESDIVIFNTCCVRENAEQKVFGHLGALKKLKKEKDDFIIAVCGCMMQQNEIVDQIKKKYKHVDIIFGTHNLHKFPELLFDSLEKKNRIIDVWDCEGFIPENLPIDRKDGVKAWVTVMYGCDNYCSYCIVPYVRGRERSRNISDIVNEVSELSNKGYKEITLLGQNVNSYGKDIARNSNEAILSGNESENLFDNRSFSHLLSELNKINGIERIRFMTSHPKDLSDDIIYAIRDLSKVCEYLHLPFQAGSNRILQQMNRKYTKDEYLRLIEKIKIEIPGISLSTDIIVGFPGETEEDFQETLNVLETVRFDSAYTFIYSKRGGTPASKMENQVTEEIKKQRFEKLLKLQNKISKEINDETYGKIFEVLVEGFSKSSEEFLTGRTRNNKIVNFKANSNLIGKLVNVKIEDVKTWSLDGSVYL